MSLEHEVIVWRLRQNIATLRLALDALEATIDDAGVSPPEHEASTERVVADEDPVVHLTLWVDGGSRGNPGEGYGSYAVFKQEGNVYSPVARDTKVFGQNMTNNVAEYEALLWGLRRLRYTTGWGLPSNVDLTIKMDSDLVRPQVCRVWQVKAEHLRLLRNQAERELDDFADWRIRHVSRAEVVAVLGH